MDRKDIGVILGGFITRQVQKRENLGGKEVVGRGLSLSL